jgi:hypothetical protein
MRRPRLNASRSRPLLKLGSVKRESCSFPRFANALPCPCRYQFSSHGSDYRRICKVNLKDHPCHRSFKWRASAAYGDALPKILLLGTPLHPLLAHTGDCWLLLAGWKHPILRCCCMEELMCCQKSRPLLPDVWKVETYLGPRESSICGVSACCGIGRRLGKLAAACKHMPKLLLLQLCFTCSRTGGLVPYW